MKSTILTTLVLSLTAIPLTTQAQLIWQVGRDDDDWPLTGTTGGPDANFVQENGAINPIPGSPISTPTRQGADNDYYFSGVYTTTLPGNVARYGDYTPVGVVAENENSAERAFAAGDLDLRYHFNLPESLNPTDFLTVTFDALNLDTNPADGTVPPPTDPRHGVEIYINGVLVQPEILIRPGELGVDYTSTPFTLAQLGAVTGPGADNIVSLRGISYLPEGGGNWMGIDYVQLNASPVPEPSSVVMIIFGAIGVAAVLRRRRA
jgi:hypothetical protein